MSARKPFCASLAARLPSSARPGTRCETASSGSARPPSQGYVEGTITALFDHYEEMGDFVIRNLADEQKLPELGEWLELGRRAHRASIQHQFAPQLADQETDKKSLLDCLVVACDVYTWQLLRRDMGRSRKDAEACVRHMVAGILGRT